MKEKRIKLEFRVMFLMIVTCLVGIMAISPQEAAAKAKMKLSRTSMTMRNDDLKTIRLRNPQKKVKWKISTKKYGHIDTYGKKNSICEIATDGNGVAGKFVVTATVGKKKFKCKVNVKAGEKQKDSETIDESEVDPEPQSTEAPQPTAAPQSTQTPSGGKAEDGFDNIKNYIKKNGILNTNGENIIRYSTTSGSDGLEYGWGIIYHESNDTLELIMVQDKLQIAVDMTMAKSDTSVEVQASNYIDVYDPFIGVTRIDKKSFTKNSSISVTLTTSPRIGSVAAARNLCVSEFKLAFTGWKILLENNGFTMADLGFTSY